MLRTKKNNDGVFVDTKNPDYRRAAQELGLISQDDEYEHAIADAVQYQSAPRLRLLLGHVLLHCEVSDPAKLFYNFYEDLSEDHRNNPLLSADQVLELTLLDMQDILGRAEQTLSNG